MNKQWSANPTMTRKSPKHQSLIRQFQSLQREWDSISKSTSPRNSSHSNKKASPRPLMHSFQHCGTSMRTHDAAVAEILRDRRAAIASGKIKGRQLRFPALGEAELEEKEVVVVEEERGNGGSSAGVVAEKAVGRWRLMAAAAGAVILGLVFMMGCNGKCVHGKEMMILVPT